MPPSTVLRRLQEGGKIDVSWALEPGSGDRAFLNCPWQGSGGPLVLPSGQRGYGTDPKEWRL